MFPNELKGLTPVEEKLIALNSSYGFITKYSVQDGHKQGVTYPRHVKGHITVFPNNVRKLVTNVLPHPLLRVMDEIHVSWQGPEKPAASDLTAFLSVRRRVVERALLWLKRHNPLYAGVGIDTAEMDSWGAMPHGVPFQIYDRFERNEPSGRKKIQTAHIVPPTKRDLEEPGAVDIQEILASLEGDLGVYGNAVSGEPACADKHGISEGRVYEISSFGMFNLDRRPDIANAEKLRYVCGAIGEIASWNQTRGRTWAGSAKVRYGSATEPYILVSRGDELADSFNAGFFASTFPTLFPFGKEGPRQAEECIMHGNGRGPTGVETEAAMRGLVLLRNINLEAWAKLVLQRHGGRLRHIPCSRSSFSIWALGQETGE
ncbi:hypothetical protein RB597_008488 [Gaeumannomyces tritici]